MFEDAKNAIRTLQAQSIAQGAIMRTVILQMQEDDLRTQIREGACALLENVYGNAAIRPEDHDLLQMALGEIEELFRQQSSQGG